MNRIVLLLILTLPIPDSTSQIEEQWDFPEEDLATDTAQLSDGELILLPSPPDQPVHHHQNKLRITHDSLNDGWVSLEQCHRQLDPVPETQIVYHAKRIRNIQLLSTENISRAWIEGPSVQLIDVGKQAEICLRAESLALTQLAKGRYRLKTGPYMRRFLDGYYPMRVSLEIDYPADALALQAFRPLPGKSGRTSRHEGYILWDSWFTGRLFTEFDFYLITQP